jgi:hypothetical protein
MAKRIFSGLEISEIKEREAEKLSLQYPEATVHHVQVERETNDDGEPIVKKSLSAFTREMPAGWKP